MLTPRSADEVRPAEFRPKAAGEADPEMVATAETIIERRSGAFEPASVRDRYQDALNQLDEAKIKGLATAPRAIADPPKDGSLEAQPRRTQGRSRRSRR